ncbi:mechanosensitive ion channel family protein [Sulfuricurvum sp.]|uniref:mechanosensitive ion channel family protein n=1 Tax=Sulfuricurvum sp. TaxID=2025608 RepID=UPI003C61591E
MFSKIEHVEDKVVHYSDIVLEYATEYGLKILGALLIFFIGKWVARKVVTLMGAGMARAHVDSTLISFASNALYVALIVIVIVAAISNIGVETTSFIAVFGAAGLAIGLALKDTLANVGAAVLIIFFRPFKVGDFIEASGVMGNVKSINLFSTTLTTADNRSIIIPNGALIAGNIINYTGNHTRRIDMAFVIDYKDDLKVAKEVVKNVLQTHAKVLNDPEPIVAVGALERDGVQLIARPWVAVDDYWNVMFEITESVKLEFDKHKITVPFPQMDLHVKRGEL